MHYSTFMYRRKNQFYKCDISLRSSPPFPQPLFLKSGNLFSEIPLPGSENPWSPYPHSSYTVYTVQYTRLEVFPETWTPTSSWWYLKYYTVYIKNLTGRMPLKNTIF